jgi:hypothetical protein
MGHESTSVVEVMRELANGVLEKLDAVIAAIEAQGGKDKGQTK